METWGRVSLAQAVCRILSGPSVRVGGAGLFGGIAQLAERQLCKLNVAGSNPAASTKRRSMSDIPIFDN